MFHLQEKLFTAETSLRAHEPMADHTTSQVKLSVGREAGVGGENFIQSARALRWSEADTRKREKRGSESWREGERDKARMELAVMRDELIAARAEVSRMREEARIANEAKDRQCKGRREMSREQGKELWESRNRTDHTREELRESLWCGRERVRYVGEIVWSA